jgi:hypothetical protein
VLSGAKFTTKKPGDKETRTDHPGLDITPQQRGGRLVSSWASRLLFATVRKILQGEKTMREWIIMHKESCADKIVMEIGKINVTGNIISGNWFKHLRTPSGKPDSIGIILLSDIFYWYRPTEMRDEATGKVTGYKRKFKADKLQRSYEQFSKQFGFTKNQVRDAIKRLESAGLITVEFRNITTSSGLRLANVMYIEAVPEKISEITFDTGEEDTTYEISRGVRGNFSTPPMKKPYTNTETTTETTTKTTEKQTNTYSESAVAESRTADYKSFPTEEYISLGQYLESQGGTSYFDPNSIEATKYYINSYRRVFNIDHPRYTKEKWSNIIDSVLLIPKVTDSGETYISEDPYDYFEIIERIDTYFQQRFRKNCNFAILHFLEPEVKWRIEQKVRCGEEN